jgi:two-component system sensor histidine kinase MprB
MDSDAPDDEAGAFLSTVRRSADRDEVELVRPHMAERALANLVDNAVKYSAGAIAVVISGNRVEVRDKGPGIAATDQAHVFDRFYRSAEARTEPGSGLGLAIVKQIVERHDGTVWATNRDGGGAAVGFELPVFEGELNSPGPTGSAASS